MTSPKTLMQAVRYFADSDNCREYLVARRWPNGVTCPTCGAGRLLRQDAERLEVQDQAPPTEVHAEDRDDL